MTTPSSIAAITQFRSLHEATERMEDLETDYQIACSDHARAVRLAGAERAKAYDREVLAGAAEYLAAHLRDGVRAADLECIATYILQSLPGISLADAEAGRPVRDLDVEDDIIPALPGYRT